MRRVLSTAPVAPMGWPWAMAPPSTLTISSGNPSSRLTAIAIAANASLISTRFRSPTFQPARAGPCITARLRASETLLRAQCPLVLCFARDLKLLRQILGVPAGMLIGKGVVETVAQHAVVEVPVAHAIAPTATCDQVRRLIHVLHAARH